jgi:hypothetical protein
MIVQLPVARKFVRPQESEDWLAIAARALPQTDPEEAVAQLQSWNFHVFMRPVGAAGHSILPSDIVFVEAPLVNKPRPV